MDDLAHAAVERAARLVAGARRIVVLTGAGVSTESGIPDYRGPEGVWTRDPRAEHLSSIDHYLADAEVRRLAWQMRRATAVWTREPNDAHRALVDLERQGRLELLVTQNVDGLHRRAGTSPERLVEVHGSLARTQCVACDDRRPIDEAMARVEAGEQDPGCRACGGILKPTVVFFGEGLDEADLHRAVAACGVADLFLAAGTSLQVHPAAALPRLARARGVPLVIANAEPTALDAEAEVVLRGRLGEVLPALAAAAA